MSADSSALQLVILRDGLLVGTEVLLPGSYVVGNADHCDIRLDDSSIASKHALLYFQNGKIVLEDTGSPVGLFVNGHKVSTCQIRSSDEIACGPFVLKTRVLTQKPGAVHPSAEAAALLNGSQEKAANHGQPLPPARPAVRPSGVSGNPLPSVTMPRAVAPPVHKPSVPMATSLSARRAKAAAVAPQVPPLTRSPVAHGGPGLAARALKQTNLAEELIVFDDDDEPTRTTAAPLLEVPSKNGKLNGHSANPPVRQRARRPETVRALPGKGRPRLYCEVYWGDTRCHVASFPLKKDKPILVAEDPRAMLPLYGFGLPEQGTRLADAAGKAFRLYVPPDVAVEQCKLGEPFVPLRTLGGSSDAQVLELPSGQAVRLTHGGMSLVAYAAPKPKRIWTNPLRGLPLLALAFFLALAAGMAYFLRALPAHNWADFNAKGLPQVAVHLIAPQPKKKELAQKKLQEIKAAARKREDQIEKKVEKAVPKAAAKSKETKVLKAAAKLTAALKFTTVSAAVDKISAKDLKNVDHHPANLLGKAGIPTAGPLGMSLGGKRGHTFGSELLHGKGGVAALANAGVGHSLVGGTVGRASARMVTAQGSIDREGVARVVNAHLQEVSSCYELALLKEPGLAGKVVLEWVIGGSGHVTSTRTKSSTLHSSAVESCIMSKLKQWVFPSPRGGSVIVTYPFLFNSVGY